MANRVLKNIDYMALLTLIYKHSNYDKNNAILLYTYIAIKLQNNRFNDIYIDKLKHDLNIIDDVENTIPFKDTSVVKKLNKIYPYHAVAEIKSTVFDIMHKGYYE